VVNLNNKRSVVVRINDRGDLVDEGRIIDLSRAAAEELAMTKSGLAKVRLEVISLGRDHRREIDRKCLRAKRPAREAGLFCGTPRMIDSLGVQVPFTS